MPTRNTGPPACTVREQHAVEAVKGHYRRHGRPPSYKELGALLGVGPPQAHALVKGAARAGRLDVHRIAGSRTQIRLLNPAAELATNDLVDEITTRRLGNALVPWPEYDPKDTALRLAA